MLTDHSIHTNCALECDGNRLPAALRMAMLDASSSAILWRHSALAIIPSSLLLSHLLLFFSWVEFADGWVSVAPSASTNAAMILICQLWINVDSLSWDQWLDGGGLKWCDRMEGRMRAGITHARCSTVCAGRRTGVCFFMSGIYFPLCSWALQLVSLPCRYVPFLIV